MIGELSKGRHRLANIVGRRLSALASLRLRLLLRRVLDDERPPGYSDIRHRALIEIVNIVALESLTAVGRVLTDANGDLSVAAG